MKDSVKNSKNIVILALLIAIVALSVGYAAFATTLNINGHAVIDSNWQVEIISITPTYTGAASETTNTPATPKFTATTATFDATLKAPGDSATYTVVVKNKGNIMAKLSSITPADFTTLNAASPAVINYSLTSAPTLNSQLAPNGEASFVFRVEFDPTATTESLSGLTTPIQKSLTATIEYVQDTASS